MPLHIRFVDIAQQSGEIMQNIQPDFFSATFAPA